MEITIHAAPFDFIFTFDEKLITSFWGPKSILQTGVLWYKMSSLFSTHPLS